MFVGPRYHLTFLIAAGYRGKCSGPANSGRLTVCPQRTIVQRTVFRYVSRGSVTSIIVSEWSTLALVSPSARGRESTEHPANVGLVKLRNSLRLNFLANRTLSSTGMPTRFIAQEPNTMIRLDWDIIESQKSYFSMCGNST